MGEAAAKLKSKTTNFLVRALRPDYHNVIIQKNEADLVKQLGKIKIG